MFEVADNCKCIASRHITNQYNHREKEEDLFLVNIKGAAVLVAGYPNGQQVCLLKQKKTTGARFSICRTL